PIPIAQARYQTNHMIYYGNAIYTQVMQGDLSPIAGARQFINQINQSAEGKVINESASITNAVGRNKVQTDITPKADYLLQLFRIQLQILRRPIIWLQIVLFTVVMLLIWLMARRLNRFISNFSQRFTE
ncbi:MAG: hypothetical protein LDL41_25610, partial [Coleofasciculus sp. S288]|nr:hypothetical protein [Coleofasciculus sp. S288]